MTRIDFYFEAEDKLQVACRLSAKAAQQKLRVLIYAADEAQASGPGSSSESPGRVGPMADRKK